MNRSVEVQGPVTLLILDGFGDSSDQNHNAPYLAGMPFFNHFRSRYASGQLQTSGEFVGLPVGQFGNSEVGHMNLGAGRIVRQDLTVINEDIQRGTFLTKTPLIQLSKTLQRSGGRLHLVGLVSDGGVHSHEDHLYTLAHWAQGLGLSTSIHAFLDGRDTLQKSAEIYLHRLKEHLTELPCVTLASLCGRYTAMDRDKRWDRTERIYRLLTYGESQFQANDGLDGLHQGYERGETDEFIAPTRLQNFQPIKDGDGVLFFNFRADRMRQLVHALVTPEFGSFNVQPRPRVDVVTLTSYDETLNPYLGVLYPKIPLVNILGEIISQRGWKQFRTAESEKYAHVTYFFNGGDESIFPGEYRHVVPSPKVATYDLEPAMSCPEVTEGLVTAIQSNQYRLLVCNLANGDMVGHTGNLQAAESACRVLDQSIHDIAEATLKVGGALLITADHGNCESMLDPEGNPHTAHTMNPVPIVIIAESTEGHTLHSGGALQDVAPTLLALLGVPQPSEMTGRSLL
ncbi:MAG: 2,3-bisphosphoglycerate-independent phosphoglycerate mutase [Holophagaceae bacterium]|jgi:2,3-bisphosphoglycerate-independent phosphoglycerate mutase